MTTLKANDDEITIVLRVPKSAFTTIAPVPATVTQHTVEQHFGIPKRAYVRMIKDGLFPFKKMGRLKIAMYEDVRRVATEGAAAKTCIAHVARRMSTLTRPDPQLHAECERYLESARSRRELRERKTEVLNLGGDISFEHRPTLDDGEPNPNADKALFDFGMSLCTLSYVTERVEGRNIDDEEFDGLRARIHVIRSE